MRNDILITFKHHVGKSWFCIDHVFHFRSIFFWNDYNPTFDWCCLVLRAFQSSLFVFNLRSVPMRNVWQKIPLDFTSCLQLLKRLLSIFASLENHHLVVKKSCIVAKRAVWLNVRKLFIVTGDITLSIKILDVKLINIYTKALCRIIMPVAMAIFVLICSKWRVQNSSIFHLIDLKYKRFNSVSTYRWDKHLKFKKKLIKSKITFNY